jgi:hypothetical protein
MTVTANAASNCTGGGRGEERHKTPLEKKYLLGEVDFAGRHLPVGEEKEEEFKSEQGRNVLAGMRALAGRFFAT